MGMPVIAIGSDRAWRYRLERMVALGSDVNWCGSFAADSTEPLRSASLWLLDGDDPAVERFCSRFEGPQPIRMYFYRRPTAPLLRRCVQVGGIGCLAKHASVEIVLNAIRSVGAGLFVVDASLLQHAIVPERTAAAVEALLADATMAVRNRVSGDGQVSAQALDREQRATHALAWLATYVEGVRQLVLYAERMRDAGRLGEAEKGVARQRRAAIVASLLVEDARRRAATRTDRALHRDPS